MQAAAASLSVIVEVVRAQSPSEFSLAFAAIAKSLKVDYACVCTMRDHLGDKKSPDAAAVVCEFHAGGPGTVLKYQKASTANWQKGAGVRRAGHYQNNSFADILSVPNTDATNGWQLLNATNSDLKML